MKKLLCLIISIVMLAGVLVMPAAAEDTVRVYVNGAELVVDQGAIIINGRTLVPLRAICEALNCDVTWDQNTQTAQIKNEVTIVAVQIENHKMSKIDRENKSNVRVIELDVPAMIYNSRTLVPARAISEALHAQVGWDGANKRVNITLEYDYIGEFKNGMAVVSKDGKCGFINEKREVVAPVEYSKAWHANEKVACLENFNQEKYILCPWGEKIPYDNLADFKNGMAVVKKGSKYGVINEGCAFVLHIEYDAIGEFTDEVAVIKKDNKYGLINPKYEIVKPVEYDTVEKFENGKALVRKNGKYGFVNTKGIEILPVEYDLIGKFNDGMALTEKGGKYGFVNSYGRIAIPVEYDTALDFSEGLAAVKMYNKWGFVDTSGNTVISFMYDWTEGFSDGIARVENDGKRGVINKNGEVIAPVIYDDIGYFSEGMSKVKKDGKYGFINKYGEEVIECVYDSAETFKDGQTRVEKDGRWFYLDENGN